MADQKTPLSMQLQCPLPKLDFEVVTLGHGSGGLLTQRLLDKVIFEGLGDSLSKQDHDAALIEIKNKVVMTTDSFVVSPIFFPGGNIGDLAVNGTINDLAVAGAIPKYLSLSLIIEEGLAIAELWEVLIAIRKSCEEADVKIITGDTKVVNKGSGDKLFINTTGIGEATTDYSFNGERVESGDVLIISGPIASHGMSIMSVRENLSFESSIESDTQLIHEPIQKLISKFGSDIKFLRDPTRGGLGSITNELAETHRVGIELQQSALPVLPQVKSACELLGLDPIYVANEGIFLAVVSADVAEQALELIKGFDTSGLACVVGTVVADHAGKVVIKTGFGGARVVNRLVGEQLPRIC